MELNKIYHQDCKEGLSKLMDNSIDLIITDPPYGISYQSHWKIDKDRFETLEGDEAIDASFLHDCFRILKEGSALYLFTRWDVYPEWAKLIKDVGFIIKNVIIWDRLSHGLGDLEGDYAAQHDFIIYATKGRHLLRGNRPKNVISMLRPAAILHPTQKPVRLIKQLICSSSDEGALVIDPFMGSGTTALAAKQALRKFIGFEVKEEFVNIANKRLNQSNLSEWHLSPDKENTK